MTETWPSSYIVFTLSMHIHFFQKFHPCSEKSPIFLNTNRVADIVSHFLSFLYPSNCNTNVKTFTLYILIIHFSPYSIFPEWYYSIPKKSIYLLYLTWQQFHIVKCTSFHWWPFHYFPLQDKAFTIIFKQHSSFHPINPAVLSSTNVINLGFVFR